MQRLVTELSGLLLDHPQGVLTRARQHQYQREQQGTHDRAAHQHQQSLHVGRQSAGSAGSPHLHDPRAIDLQGVTVRELVGGCGSARPAHELRALAGIAVVQRHGKAAVSAKGRPYESGDMERARNPAGERRTALCGARQAGAASIEGGFDEEAANPVSRDGVNQKPPAVRERLHELRLRGPARRIPTDRGAWIAPVSLQQPCDAWAVRSVHAARREQAIAGTPIRDDRFKPASHERAKCRIGVTPCPKGREFGRRHRPDDQCAKASHLSLVAFQLREPLIEAAGAQTGLHGQHTAQRRYEVSIATQQRLQRPADVGRGGLKRLLLMRAHARAPQQSAGNRDPQAKQEDRAGDQHPPASSVPASACARCGRRSAGDGPIERLRHGGFSSRDLA